MKHERKLLALPIPACPELEQREEEKINSWRRIHYYRFAAELVEIEGSKVLAITVFDENDKAKFRVFQSKNQTGMQTFEKMVVDYRRSRVPGRMYEGGIDSCINTGNYCYGYGKKDQAPSEKVKKFYKKWEREIVASKLKQQKEAKTA